MLLGGDEQQKGRENGYQYLEFHLQLLVILKIKQWDEHALLFKKPLVQLLQFWFFKKYK